MKSCEHGSCGNEVEGVASELCVSCSHYFCRTHSIDNVFIPGTMRKANDPHCSVICSYCCNKHYRALREHKKESTTTETTQLTDQMEEMTVQLVAQIDELQRQVQKTKTERGNSVIELQTRIQQLLREKGTKEVELSAQHAQHQRSIQALINDHDRQYSIQKNEIKQLLVESQVSENKIVILTEQNTSLTQAKSDLTQKVGRQELEIARLSSHLASEKDEKGCELKQAAEEIQALKVELKYSAEYNKQLSVDYAKQCARVAEVETILSKDNDRIGNMEHIIGMLTIENTAHVDLTLK